MTGRMRCSLSLVRANPSIAQRRRLPPALMAGRIASSRNVPERAVRLTSLPTRTRLPSGSEISIVSAAGRSTTTGDTATDAGADSSTCPARNAQAVPRRDDLGQPNAARCAAGSDRRRVAPQPPARWRLARASQRLSAASLPRSSPAAVRGRCEVVPEIRTGV
jgi:hypothetical protein